MARLSLHTAQSAPQKSRPYVERVIAGNGFLPNLIAALANAPAALETYLTVSEINARTSLSVAEREVVQITAASIHGCDFCVAGHSALALKKGGLDAATVVALQERGHTGTERLDALAAFTRAVIVSRGAVGDGEYRDFLGSGYTAAQALEVILGISLATLCNFTNNLAGSAINPELEPYRHGVLRV
jgi:uncharacterized peroxidase-related enzyme